MANTSGCATGAAVLREVADYDGGLDPRRGALTAAQAALLEACASHLTELPPQVAARAHGVAAAVDAATCGVPEVGPGSLTSDDRWSDMIPACRCGCCT
jgi:hypothetical protein